MYLSSNDVPNINLWNCLLLVIRTDCKLRSKFAGLITRVLKQARNVKFKRIIAGNMDRLSYAFASRFQLLFWKHHGWRIHRAETLHIVLAVRSSRKVLLRIKYFKLRRCSTSEEFSGEIGLTSSWRFVEYVYVDRRKFAFAPNFSVIRNHSDVELRCSIFLNFQFKLNLLNLKNN